MKKVKKINEGNFIDPTDEQVEAQKRRIIDILNSRPESYFNKIKGKKTSTKLNFTIRDPEDCYHVCL